MLLPKPFLRLRLFTYGNCMNPNLAWHNFPRSTGYNPDWLMAGVSGGANPLLLTEWLSQALDLQAGMRVLDLGCGRALSSIFLAREFGVQVWAADLWFDASENLMRVRDAGLDGQVFPLHMEARNLPFAAEFFDVIVACDSFPYFGTDDLYLAYVTRFLKPGGQLGIVGSGLAQEPVGTEAPEHLRSWWEPEAWMLHSVGWWRRHWEKTGIVDIETADLMPDGWRFWLDWIRTVAPENKTEINALEDDQGSFLAYTRVIARRKANAVLSAPVRSITTSYAKKGVQNR